MKSNFHGNKIQKNTIRCLLQFQSEVLVPEKKIPEIFTSSRNLLFKVSLNLSLRVCALLCSRRREYGDSEIVFLFFYSFLRLGYKTVKLQL